jgi:hypothetical protein
MALPVSPFLLPEAYDVVLAAGVPSPGIATVKGASRIYKWDKKDGPGAAGANMTFRGLDIAELSIELQLWTPEHLELWGAWSAIWAWNPVKKQATPVTVEHPYLSDLGIFTLAAKAIPQLDFKGGGMWLGRIECIEWRPPPKKNVASSPTKTQTATGNAARAAPPVQDQLDQQIAALLQQAKQV